MELFLPRSKRDLKALSKTLDSARFAAKLTGKTVLYHWVDAIFCFFRYGCDPLQYFEGSFFKLRSFDRDEAYTRKRIQKVRSRYNERKYEYLLSSKSEFNKLFADFLKRDWIDCKTASAAEIENFVRKTGRCLMKPTDGSKGKGIKEINIEDAKEVSLSCAGNNYILEEFIKQHPKMSFSNKSVNTLRMMTVMDSSGEVHLIKVAFRCGVGEAVVDNFCAGGVLYPVDIQYGRISAPGVTCSLGQHILIHPGTDTYMIGYEIPFWKQTVEMLTEVAKRIPQVRFVGWDIAISSDGPVLIEGNQYPGVIFEPLSMKHGIYKEMMSYQ